jgi:hypothetical protein
MASVLLFMATTYKWNLIGVGFGPEQIRFFRRLNDNS